MRKAGRPAFLVQHVKHYYFVMNRYVYMLFLIPTFIMGCHYYNHDLSFKNNTSLTLAVSYSNSKDDANENNIAYYVSEAVIIKPDSVWYMVKPGKKDAWLDYIDEGNKKELIIYVWDVDTLRKYDSYNIMSDLKNSHKYIKSFSINKQ
jgi:hypothetical protein